MSSMKSFSLQKISTSELGLGDYIILPHEDWLKHSFSHNEFVISSAEQISDLLNDGVNEVWRRVMNCEQDAEILPEANRFASGLFIPTTSRTRGEGVESKQGHIQKFREGLPFLWQDAYATMRSLSEVRKKIQKELEKGAQSVFLAELMSEYEKLFSNLYDAILCDFRGYAYVINTGMCVPKCWDVDVRVGILAGALGHVLGFDKEQVSDLVLIGLLHDVGLARSGRPPKRQESNNKRFIAWQTALAKHGVDILSEANIFSSNVIRGVASQFEKYCGEGFPEGVSGKEISAEARILHIARTYCQYLGAGRLRLCPQEALSLMFFDFRDFFDDEYLMCFLKLLGVYPVGTYVEITGEKTGVVVDCGETLNHVSIVTYEEGIPNSEVMPSLLGEIRSNITENVPPYLLSKKKMQYFSFV